jgi:hypothetical protein
MDDTQPCCTCDCHDGDVTLSDQEARAWVAAVAHLTTCGLLPLVNLPTCRALWRHGEKALALRLARLRGVA